MRTVTGAAAREMLLGRIRRNLVLLLRPLEQPHEVPPLPKRIEPRIAGHGGITKDPAPDHTLEKLHCGIDLVQVCQMPRQI